MEKLGQACKTTRYFGLQKEFPTVERDYQEHVLARLVDRQQWQAALTVCNDDGGLQVGWDIVRWIIVPQSHCTLNGLSRLAMEQKELA